MVCFAGFPDLDVNCERKVRQLVPEPPQGQPHACSGSLEIIDQPQPRHWALRSRSPQRVVLTVLLISWAAACYPHAVYYLAGQDASSRSVARWNSQHALGIDTVTLTHAVGSPQEPDLNVISSPQMDMEQNGSRSLTFFLVAAFICHWSSWSFATNGHGPAASTSDAVPTTFWFQKIWNVRGPKVFGGEMRGGAVEAIDQHAKA